MHKGLKLTGPATAGRQLWGGGEGGLNVRYLFYTPVCISVFSVFVFVRVLVCLSCICICLKGVTDRRQTVLVCGGEIFVYCQN